MSEELINELRAIMEVKGISAETASKFIDCSFKQVYLWLKGKAKPTRMYQKAIRRGIKRIEKL